MLCQEIAAAGSEVTCRLRRGAAAGIPERAAGARHATQSHLGRVDI
jgi:hypothetical protein